MFQCSSKLGWFFNKLCLKSLILDQDLKLCYRKVSIILNSPNAKNQKKRVRVISILVNSIRYHFFKMKINKYFIQIDP